jgi:hypothetical protein
MGRGPIDVVAAGLRNTWLVNTVRDSDARAADPLKVPGAEIVVVSESRHLHPWRCHPDPLPPFCHSLRPQSGRSGIQSLIKALLEARLRACEGIGFLYLEGAQVAVARLR